jgi:formylglycine-generating enzyme required for sulfatase activity
MFKIVMPIALLTLLLPPSLVWGADAGPPLGMATIPAGEFMAGEPGALRPMYLDAFYLDIHEVTQKDFEALMGKNPSSRKGADHPVEMVTWFEAREYCQKSGKRLPTEWEWEKAAKAGTVTAYYWGNEPDPAYAWFGEAWSGGHHPVGQKKTNAYGLYDMSGNVWEWTATAYDFRDKEKVVRGGSWQNVADAVASANRSFDPPVGRFANTGFRCAQ